MGGNKKMSAIKPVIMDMHLLLVKTFFSNGIVKNNFCVCVCVFCVFVTLEVLRTAIFFNSKERSSHLMLSVCALIFSFF